MTSFSMKLSIITEGVADALTVSVPASCRGAVIDGTERYAELPRAYRPLAVSIFVMCGTDTWIFSCSAPEESIIHEFL